MDERLWEKVQRLWMRQKGDSAEEEAIGRLLTSLPARFRTSRRNPPTSFSPTTTSITSRVRCAKLWSDKLSSFMEVATQPERDHLVENASKIGRSWLRQIPYFEPLRLSNHEIADGLHYRLLTPSSTTCAACAQESGLGHNEVCKGRPTWAIRRHNTINRVLHSYLPRVAGAVIQHDPPTRTGQQLATCEYEEGGGVHCQTTT
ncbi:hypothetical protein B9479_007791 [Cryptococcus floricola]|uniref:Uncharacterized protein n=1 Tax=Cryptococcus floricola TaxID=2591691 RepID=A0A5D3ALV8_9TREE|nr:hypothetical protein B9479_007791 [Cryptococcus floricola]